MQLESLHDESSKIQHTSQTLAFSAENANYLRSVQKPLSIALITARQLSGYASEGSSKHTPDQIFIKIKKALKP